MTQSTGNWWHRVKTCHCRQGAAADIRHCESKSDADRAGPPCGQPLREKPACSSSLNAQNRSDVCDLLFFLQADILKCCWHSCRRATQTTSSFQCYQPAYTDFFQRIPLPENHPVLHNYDQNTTYFHPATVALKTIIKKIHLF